MSNAQIAFGPGQADDAAAVNRPIKRGFGPGRALDKQNDRDSFVGGRNRPQQKPRSLNPFLQMLAIMIGFFKASGNPFVRMGRMFAAISFGGGAISTLQEEIAKTANGQVPAGDGLYSIKGAIEALVGMAKDSFEQIKEFVKSGFVKVMSMFAEFLK